MCFCFIESFSSFPQKIITLSSPQPVGRWSCCWVWWVKLFTSIMVFCVLFWCVIFFTKMMEKYIYHFFEKDTETGQRDNGTTGHLWSLNMIIHHVELLFFFTLLLSNYWIYTDSVDGILIQQQGWKVKIIYYIKNYIL